MAKEYIERETAYDTLTEYYHHSTDTQHGALREALSRVPAADVRPVVRCENCIHLDRGENESESWFYCKLNAHDRYEGFYCADGKMREAHDG